LDEQPHLLALSARSKSALDTLALNYIERLSEQPEPSLRDVCFTALDRRSQHEHRLAISSTTTFGMVDALGAYLSGEQQEEFVFGRAQKCCSLVFVYSGMGPQWWAMGRQLYTAEPIFREVIDCCDRLLSKLAPWSLLEELHRDQDSSRMAD